MKKPPRDVGCVLGGGGGGWRGVIFFENVNQLEDNDTSGNKESAVFC